MASAIATGKSPRKSSRVSRAASFMSLSMHHQRDYAAYRNIRFAAMRTRHLNLVKRDHEVSRCLRSTQGPCPAWQGDSVCEEVIEVHAEGPKMSGGKRAVFRSRSQ
jgi:hypothetical protein